MIKELMQIDLSHFDGNSMKERCGIIVRNREGTYEIREVPNTADKPRHSFRVLVKDVEAAANGDHVAGYLHTHPRGAGSNLSYADVVQMEDNMIGLLFHPTSGSRIVYNNTGPIMSDIKKRRR